MYNNVCIVHTGFDVYQLPIVVQIRWCMVNQTMEMTAQSLNACKMSHSLLSYEFNAMLVSYHMPIPCNWFHVCHHAAEYLNHILFA